MNMKKLFLICLCFSVSLTAFCQKTDAASLEASVDLGKETYQDRAKKYLSTYKLNDNGELEITSYLQVGDTKQVMYNNLINWIVMYRGCYSHSLRKRGRRSYHYTLLLR